MKERTYSKCISNVIYDFLEGDNWQFSFDDKEGIFKFGLLIKGPIKRLRYIVDVKENEYIVYAIPPLGADDSDEKMMSSMAEFVCHANYGLKNGNFEFDMRDGEVRFKSYVDCNGVTPTMDIVKNSIYCPAAMFDHYGTGILSIILGNSTAKAAMAGCGNSLQEKLLAILGEEMGEGESMDDVIARLVKKSDADENKSGSAAEQKSADETIDIKIDLFNAKGGTA